MDNTFQLISKINDKMRQFITEELSKNGVNDLVSSHGSIILALNHNEDVKLLDLAKKTGKSPQTMTTLVRKLENEGYVQIRKADHDKREKNVSLTSKGKDFIPVMNSISLDLLKKQYKGLNDKEQFVLRELLQKVLHNF